jgi:hypothetical protein
MPEQNVLGRHRTCRAESLNSYDRKTCDRVPSAVYGIVRERFPSDAACKGHPSPTSSPPTMISPRRAPGTCGGTSRHSASAVPWRRPPNRREQGFSHCNLSRAAVPRSCSAGSPSAHLAARPPGSVPVHVIERFAAPPPYGPEAHGNCSSFVEGSDTLTVVALRSRFPSSTVRQLSVYFLSASFSRHSLGSNSRACICVPLLSPMAPSGCRCPPGFPAHTTFSLHEENRGLPGKSTP